MSILHLLLGRHIKGRCSLEFRVKRALGPSLVDADYFLFHIFPNLLTPFDFLHLHFRYTTYLHVPILHGHVCSIFNHYVIAWTLAEGRNSKIKPNTTLSKP